MKTIETWLPVFSGFYGTIWEPDESNEIESINQEREAKGLDKINYNDCQWDYDSYHDQVIKGVSRQIESALYELGLVKDITVQRLVSPKEYNFHNDSVNIAVRLTKKNEKTILTYLTKHSSLFAQYLKGTYTSCSGFISSYPNYIEGFMEENPLEHTHKLGSILNFICQNEEIDELDTLYYKVEAYLTCLNYNELIEGNVESAN